MENKFAEKMLKMVTDDLDAVHAEMKELDRLYINKQKQVRQLQKARAELEVMMSTGETLTV